MTLCHPHGIIGAGIWAFVTRARLQPHRCACVVVGPLIVPFGTFWAWWFGCACSSSAPRAIASLMRARRDVFVYPGGFVEAARHSYGKDVVDVGSRGAIRLALEHGYAVRVAFAFGESKTAYNLQGLWSVRMWLAKRGVSAVAALLVPLARTPRVVVSPPMQLPALASPTHEDVERWHRKYVEALRALHAEFRGVDDELVVHDEYERWRAR